VSAFVVSATHVDVLLSVALHGPNDGVGPRRNWQPPYLNEADAQLSSATCSPTGAALLAENIASVAHRYPNDALHELPGPMPMPMPAQYEFTDFGPCLTIAEACAAIDCYAYQSCEHPKWEASSAHAFCERLRAALVGRLPGYDAAPWEWTPETLAERGLIAAEAALYGGRNGR
jgi:hypothetical protein